jgi:4-hydroxy-tetrahydrodipicolinate reductase
MPDPTRIAIAGAGGRMGQALVAAVLDAADLALSAALDVAGAPAIGVDAGAALGRATGIRVGHDVATALANVDVLIDFTRPDGTVAHAAACAKHGVALVAGTTGLSAAQNDELARHARAECAPRTCAPRWSTRASVSRRLHRTPTRSLSGAARSCSRRRSA